MIVAIVRFPTEGASPEEMKKRYRSTAPKYRKVSGLALKYYVLSEDGKVGGGVYLFESKKAAENLYSKEWRNYIRDFYGSEPMIEYFDCPVVVDNLSGEILAW